MEAVILQLYYTCIRRSELDIFILCEVHAITFYVQRLFLCFFFMLRFIAVLLYCFVKIVI